MSTIWNNLCQYQNQWYLVSWDADKRQGSLIVGKAMPREGLFISADGFHDGMSISSFRGITLYPEVRYRGVKVYPQYWDPESSEPMVVCHMPTNIDMRDTAEERKALVESLLNEGWNHSAWQGLARAVHVDELEKIEGPPPEGPF